MSGSHDTSLRVGGLTPMTTIDYPGQLAAVVYCQGCPWRCRYCHNGHLLESDGLETVSWPETLAFLQRRADLLDAVVFSGGEPTAQGGLQMALSDVRKLGFLTGLHTGGAYPARLERAMPLLDWVGLDIKAMPEDYPALTGVEGSGEKAWQSLGLLQAAGIPFDVRVTVHDTLLPPDRLNRLLGRLRSAGVSFPVLQACRNEHLLDPSLLTDTHTVSPTQSAIA